MSLNQWCTGAYPHIPSTYNVCISNQYLILLSKKKNVQKWEFSYRVPPNATIYLTKDLSKDICRRKCFTWNRTQNGNKLIQAKLGEITPFYFLLVWCVRWCVLYLYAPIRLTRYLMAHRRLTGLSFLSQSSWNRECVWARVRECLQVQLHISRDHLVGTISRCLVCASWMCACHT